MKFWKKVLWIGIPVAIQNLINTLLNMVDTIMITSVSEACLSAVGLANKVFFAFNLLTFGVVSGSSVLASQYYGKKDDEGLNKVFGFSLVLSIMGAFIFFILALTIPEGLMRIFTNEEEIILIGASYLRIVATSYLFTAVSFAITGLLRSVNKTRAPMIITLVSVLVNILANYIFIFGKLGIPAMNSDGAALGTLISRAVELTALVLYLKFCKKDFVLDIKLIKNVDKAFLKKAFHFALPVIINEFGWGLGTTLYSVIYGHMSNDVVAAMTIATVLQDLIYALIFGLSNACAILVGNELGADNLEKAKVVARKLLIANTILGVVLACLMVVLINPYLLMYPNSSESVKHYVRLVCIVFAFAMPFKTFNLTNICGALRSGGDTIFCMLLDLGGVWLYAIPVGFITAFGFNLDVQYVYAGICTEELVKAGIGYFRLKQGKWVRNITITN